MILIFGVSQYIHTLIKLITTSRLISFNFVSINDIESLLYKYSHNSNMKKSSC